MHLLWMILFSVCLLAACGASDPLDVLVDKENVGRRRVQLRRGSRRGQQIDERVISEDDDHIVDDQTPQDQINSYDGDSRKSRIKSDSARDGKDADQTGRGRIRVLSAGFRRTGDSSLRPLHDPTLTDDDLNRIDDHNIENELNALAEGLSQKHDVGDIHVDDNYEGLGFGDTAKSSLHNRVDSIDHDFINDAMDKNTHFGPPWSDWRHCNVTCGVGKQSRWRRCRDDSEGNCNRVTGRQVEWRRCLGMECDQKTIEDLGGGCKDQLMMSLLLGVLIGTFGCLSLTAIISGLYACYKKPIKWKLSDLCPKSCTNSCAGCSERCTECWQEFCDPYTGCCAGCGGPCLCCWCQPCCDPHARQDRLYYHKQMMMNNAYQHHNLGPPGPGPGGRMPYKRPPAPLPRESVKRKPYYEDPEYAEIDQFYQDSPRKKRKEKQKEKQKQNYVKITKKPAQQYHDSFDEDVGRHTKKKAREKVENDYLDILGDEDVENAYLTPTMEAERYESDYEHLYEEPPAQPQ